MVIHKLYNLSVPSYVEVFLRRGEIIQRYLPFGQIQIYGMRDRESDPGTAELLATRSVRPRKPLISLAYFLLALSPDFVYYPRTGPASGQHFKPWEER